LEEINKNSDSLSLSIGYRYFKNQNYENDSTDYFLFFLANILLIEIIFVHLRSNQQTINMARQ